MTTGSGISQNRGATGTGNGRAHGTAEGDTGRLTDAALGFPMTTAVPPPDRGGRREQNAGDRASRPGAALESEYLSRRTTATWATNFGVLRTMWRETPMT